MYPPNVESLLKRLTPADVVLDVGGWACPFNRAQWVLDAEPFATRGYYRTFGGAASQGGDQEWFTAETWVQRDICDHKPWPFADKQFDFVVCSHTLEDIRDPLWVCSELMRVGKRGYIEVPSRAWETCRAVEHPRLAGLSHHRWLIDIGDHSIRFLPKYHLIHSHWRFSLPAGFLRRLRPEQSIQWLWWEREFSYEEVTIHGIDNQRAELANYVSRVHPYPAWRLRLDDWLSSATRFGYRIRNRLARLGTP
jgi:Methyltransferase domain